MWLMRPREVCTDAKCAMSSARATDRTSGVRPPLTHDTLLVEPCATTDYVALIWQPPRLNKKRIWIRELRQLTRGRAPGGAGDRAQAHVDQVDLPTYAITEHEYDAVRGRQRGWQ